jgi:sortase A
VRRAARTLGTLLIVAGAALLAWSLVVWRWQDPFTALYTRWEQRALESRYEARLADYRPPPVRKPRSSLTDLRRRLAREARRYRRASKRGDAIGRIEIPRLDVSLILVNGTDSTTLKKGPGRHLRTFMPGEGELVYIAGHRTTYLAPFSDIDDLEPGDRVSLELPYATFEYRIVRHRIVRSDYVAALRSRGREEIALQACWPRFFASHRYIAYARPLRVRPRHGRVYRYDGTRLSAAGRHR